MEYFGKKFNRFYIKIKIFLKKTQKKQQQTKQHTQTRRKNKASHSENKIQISLKKLKVLRLAEANQFHLKTDENRPTCSIVFSPHRKVWITNWRCSHQENKNRISTEDLRMCL